MYLFNHVSTAQYLEVEGLEKIFFTCLFLTILSLEKGPKVVSF